MGHWRTENYRAFGNVCVGGGATINDSPVNLTVNVTINIASGGVDDTSLIAEQLKTALIDALNERKDETVRTIEDHYA